MKKMMIVLLFISLVESSLYAQKKIDVFTAATIVDLVKSRLEKIKTFRGSFRYSFDGKNYWGKILYKAPNRFVMNYLSAVKQGEEPTVRQKILSDGKELWIVIKDQNFAIREKLDNEEKNPLIGWNIKRLLREYVATLPKEGYKVRYGKSIAYKLVFVPKSNTSSFRSLYMIISDKGYIQKVSAVNQLSKRIDFAISYGSINTAILDEEFIYDPDEETQIYENILIPENK